MKNRRNISSEKWIVLDLSDGCDIKQQNKELDKNSCIRIIINEHDCVDFLWGEYYEIGTAAYWISQTKIFPQNSNFKVGRNLLEEVVFCLLGGHGIPAEMGIEAFKMIKEAGIISNNSIPSEHKIEAVLRRPINMRGSIRNIHYRFPTQKSKRIHNALKTLSLEVAPQDPVSLRQWLLGIQGIGPKTASWIVRNHLGSDSVAIIDIHIQRAGVAAGFFSQSWRLPQHYNLFEQAFLGYARIGSVRASVLDACIWDQMRRFGKWVRNLLPKEAKNELQGHVFRGGEDGGDTSGTRTRRNLRGGIEDGTFIKHIKS